MIWNWYTFFYDELEFNQDIQEAVQFDYELCYQLNDVQQILKRSNSQLNDDKLNIQISQLEKEMIKI